MTNIRRAHAAQVLLMQHRVDGDEPEKVIFLKIAVDLYPVNSIAIGFILSGNARDKGIDLRLLKIFQAHIHTADHPGLLRHMDDGICLRIIKTEKHIGQGGEDQHGNQQ